MIDLWSERLWNEVVGSFLFLQVENPDLDADYRQVKGTEQVVGSELENA